MALYRLAYARVSSQEQNIELQISQFEALGYDELFQEKISGRKRDRIEFTKLTERALELSSQGHDVHVFVIEWSRWARDTAFALDTLKLLEDAGVLVIETTTGAPLTLTTADGFISTSMKSVMAHYYSIELGGRAKRAYDARKLKRRTTSNRPIWGYQHSSDKSHWIPGDDWRVCRGAIEQFMDGGSINGICRWLAQSHGITKSRNGFLSWLKHPALRGHSRYRNEVLFNTHKPLITEAEWRTVQQRIKQNRKLRGRNQGRVYAIANGLCRCAVCDRSMASKISTHGRYFYCYYACSLRDGSCDAPRKYLRDAWAEAAIQNAIQEQAERVVNRLPDDATIDPRLAEREQELKALRPLSHRPAIQAEIEAIALEIEQIKASSAVGAEDVQKREQMIIDLAGLLPGDWAQLSAQERRDFYAYLVREVRVLGAEVINVTLW